MKLSLVYLREDLLEREVVDVFELSTGELSEEPAEPSASSSSSNTDSGLDGQRKTTCTTSMCTYRHMREDWKFLLKRKSFHSWGTSVALFRREVERERVGVARK